MKFRILIVLSIFVGLCVTGKLLADEFTFAWVGCDGTVVTRTSVGKLEISYTDKNLSGCLGPKSSSGTQADITGNTSTHSDQQKTAMEQVMIEELDSDESIIDLGDGEPQGPILDLAQTDIVAYRIELMRQRQIRYNNALRSVRMRDQATKKSETVAYLMRNDAVVVTQTGSGWTGVQGANVSVTDTGANLVEADTTGKADGYIATKYLRDPNSSDLVRLEQADQQFWSDIARVNVDHSVNVRAHPWYGAKILFVLTDATPVYVVSTVDNWSEIISDDRTIHGYIRSDYLTIEKYQRVEVEPLLK